MEQWTDLEGRMVFASREEAVAHIKKQLASELRSQMEHAKNYRELSEAFRAFKVIAHGAG
jgi:hypothetical protein